MLVFLVYFILYKYNVGFFSNYNLQYFVQELEIFVRLPIP